MAKAKFISELELEYIRIGRSLGINAAGIAHYLNRDRVTIHNKIRQMERHGTIGQLPFGFVLDRIAADMQRVEAERQSGLKR